MNDKWLDFAIRIQSIAQAGLEYGKDKYDLERYQELRQIAAEMVAVKTDIPVGKVYVSFAMKKGTRRRRLIPERLCSLMARFSSFVKTPVSGHSRAVGVM